eukprot:Rhum_TRINITY_DN17364_c0_g1::Rhum_TRINITY_DN17364_c0_g1_i1::g.165837::m.165837
MAATDAVKTIMTRIEGAKGDPFKTLGLEVQTTDEDSLKKAYREIVIKLHPDKCKVAGARDAFQEADKAYKLLKDPSKLKAFQDAEKKKKEQDDFRTNYSTLEKKLREAGMDGAAGRDQRAKMDAQLSPEERAKLHEEKANREYFLRMERQIREKEDRRKRARDQKADEELREEEMRDTNAQWKAHKSGKRTRVGAGVALKQNVGAVRTSDLQPNSSAVQMDYKQVRKSWQDAAAR